VGIPENEIPIQGEVILEIDGSPILGKYKVSGGTITVTSTHGRKSAEVGGLPAIDLARTIVYELSRGTRT
jgi:hypothetical protein